MKIARIARLMGLGALLCVPFALASAKTPAPAKPVALVYSLAGDATLTAPAEARRPLRLFDRLVAGSTVEVGPDALLALAFANGRRYELGERSKTTLGRVDLSSRSGSVRSLPTVPPLPRLSPIAEAEQPGLSAGAVRIRSERIGGLYPRHGAATLAGATTLRFEAVAGGGKYRVEVQDRQGSVVFSTETTDSAVTTGRILKSGMRYDWTVRTIERAGPVATGQADFVTLTAEEAKTREALRKAVEAAEDGASLVLLAEVDRSLGLLIEARDEFRVAVRTSPGDVKLTATLAEFERRLSSPELEAPASGEPETGAVVEEVNSEGQVRQRTAAEGVVVEEVTRESSARKDGIEPGDVILSWSRAIERPADTRRGFGRIDSPFDLTAAEIEEAPRGTVTLAGRRGAGESTWTLPPGRWGLTVRPALRDELFALYEEGRRRIAEEGVEAGVARWRSAAQRAAADRERDPWLAAWFSSRAGKTFAELQLWADADAAYGEAVAQAEARRVAATAAQLLREWGQVFEKRSEWNRAEDCFRRSLALDKELDAASLTVALDFHRLGALARKRGDLAAAREHNERALAIREALAPGSVDVAHSLNGLGNVAWSKGDLEAAAEYYRRSLAVHEAQAPESMALAGTLNNLGALHYDRGELAAADEYYRRSLALEERLAPGSLEVAATLNNLGATAHTRGDYAAAEDYFRRSLAIKEALQPESLDIAVSWNNLGVIARARGDLEAAEDCQRRALAIQERLSPESLEVAASLELLGNVMGFRGELAAAEDYHRRALGIRQNLAPGSIPVADSLNNLGELAKRRGDLGRADEFFRRALDAQQRLAPTGLDVARSHQNLGDVASLRGVWSVAADHYRRALEIRDRDAPGSADQAESLHALGLTQRRSGKPGLAPAAESLCRAIDALESQKAKLGGSQDAKSVFATPYAGYYHDCLVALLDLGREEEALRVLERSRARSLLSMLAERDLLFAADLPTELDRERRRADADYDRAQAELAELDPAASGEEIERLVSRLRALRAKQEEVSAKIRQASPRLASLQYPEPLDLAGARGALDPGTAFLAYSVGEEETVLLVIPPASAAGASGLAVIRIPVGQKALRDKVEAFRNLIGRREAIDRKILAQQARGLYNLLIHPAERLIRASERVLLSPDGPLHGLPFAALMRDRQYFVAWKPIHTVISATVYAELKRTRRAERSPAVLVAFGDPSYPALSPEQAERIPSPELRAVVDRGYALAPLPSTREEVEGIASLYPERALVYLGKEATEERAKAVGSEARYLHFACHGLLDERFPLNSALALTIPEKAEAGQENGLLQAWEIFERMRIDADLVVLSACETALGKEMGGEGLVGLTRAFQYAGARSIVASLWSVADESTAALMKGFYRYMRAGKSKDEALRQAQVDLIRSPKKEFSHPYYWAAFQLSGDWR